MAPTSGSLPGGFGGGAFGGTGSPTFGQLSGFGSQAGAGPTFSPAGAGPQSLSPGLSTVRPDALRIPSVQTRVVAPQGGGPTQVAGYGSQPGGSFWDKIKTMLGDEDFQRLMAYRSMSGGGPRRPAEEDRSSEYQIGAGLSGTAMNIAGRFF